MPTSELRLPGHVWLIGAMGSGKSSVGAALAARLEVTGLDTDDDVERVLGCSIESFWAAHGETAFRDVEASEVERIAATNPPAVIATGGGVVLRSANVAAMRASGHVVWLTADPKTLAGRIGNPKTRPLLDGGDRVSTLTAILEARRSSYREAADTVIDTDGREVAEVVDAVVEALEAAWAGS